MKKSIEKVQESGKPLAILIVEDSKGLNRLIRKRLEREGFVTEQAFNGAEVIAYIEENPNVIMLLDYVLPDMTARQILETLSETGRDVPFVIMTGHGDEQIAVEMMKLGARDYIIKQGSFIDMLLQVLTRVWREIDQAQRLARAEDARRESKRRFRETLETVNLIAVMLDLEGKIIFCNDFLLNLTGWNREEVLGHDWFSVFLPVDVQAEVYSVFEAVIRHGKGPAHYENEIITKWGERRMVAWSNTILRDTDGNIIGTNSFGEDITERKQAEQRQHLTAQILSLLNASGSQTDLVQEILLLIKHFAGIEAVGIRLCEGEDFPYYATIGFAEEFVEVENSLCMRDQDGEYCHDAEGEAVLVCACGKVISGKIDLSYPFFTRGGSFWLNSVSDFLTSATPAELQICQRKTCAQAGYESIALIPLKSNDNIIGLLQLNDRRKNRFTAELIGFFENIGASIGIAIARRQTEEKLLQLQKAFETMHIGVTVTSLERRIIYTNPADANMHGYTVDDLLGQYSNIFAPAEFEQPLSLTQIEATKNWIRESINVRKDGSRFPVQLNSDVVRDEQGNPLAIVTACEDISERKQTENMIRHERNLLQTLIDNIPDYIFVKDEQGRFLINNRAHILACMASTQEELIGSTDFEIYPPELATKHHAEDQEVLSSGKPLLNFEECIQAFDGHEQWLLSSKIPLYDDQGKIVGIVGISRDISAQKYTERMLRHQTMTLRERVKELHCLFELSHLIETPGISLERVFASTVYLLPAAWQFPEVTCARIIVYGKEYVTANFRSTTWKQESRIRVHHEQVGTVEVGYLEERPPSDEGPFLTEEWSLINTIAERLGEVIERKYAEEALRDSQNFLRSSLDALSAHIAILNDSGDIMEVNASWRRFADHNDLHCPDYCISQNYLSVCDTATGSSSEGAAEIARGIREILTHRREEYYYAEYPCHSPSEERWFALRATSFQNHGPIRVVVSHENITERKQAERALQHTLDDLDLRVKERTRELSQTNILLQKQIAERERTEVELQQAKELAEAANQAKSAFLANMSHELRTPLNAILGYAQILKADTTLNDKQIEEIETIHKSGQYLLQMITDVLDLSKIEAGRMELYPNEFHLPHFLQSLTDMLRIRAKQKGITFTCDFDPLLPVGVYADEKRLREVLLNLLSNAVKFTNQGGVTLQVTNVTNVEEEHLKSSNVTLQFSITDTGIGIEQHKLAEIFLPFHQVGEQNYHAEGTGLGLAISHKLVEMMGGELKAESQVGQGSCFWFRVELPDSVHGVSAARVYTPKICGYQGTRRTVLVIDDKVENRKVAVELLLPLGFRIVEADNGQEGLEKAQQFLPDVILLDLRMPGMDGFKVSQRIRQIAALDKTAIIAISASAFEETRRKSLEAGCDDFLAKPFQLHDLLGLLQRHLDLDWDCEDLPQQTQETKTKEIDLSAALRQLPTEHRQKLFKEAERGNVKGILEQLDRFDALHEEFHAPVSELRALARGFQVDTILELLEKLSLEKELS